MNWLYSNAQKSLQIWNKILDTFISKYTKNNQTLKHLMVMESAYLVYIGLCVNLIPTYHSY